MRQPQRAALTFSILTMMASTAGAWNWADDTSEITQAPEFAVSKAICRNLRDKTPPLADRPSDTAAESLARCDSETLYYGIGEPRQPERARACALREAGSDEDDGQIFGGKSILMMIYANGLGVTRDLDLATSMACRIEGAPAEVDGRVRHLRQLKSENWQGHDFDYCDDITSGLSGGFCAARDADIADVQRDKRMNQLIQDWPAADRRAFAALRNAEKAYAQASAENEVDLSGTARVALEIGQEQHLHERFEALLDQLGGCGLLRGVSADDYAPADARLNAVYGRIMAIQTPAQERGAAGSDGSLPWITVTRGGIRRTERVWLRYREAWVAFAALRYPTLAADALRARLTLQRIDELTPFLPDASPGEVFENSLSLLPLHPVSRQLS